MSIVPVTFVRQPGDHLLGEVHQVVVGGVGLVELEHGELGVVAGGQPLVAEVAVDLEDLVEAAHHQALEVQLRGDAQVEVHVEGVVVGAEWLGRGPAGHRLHHRRLHLHEAAVAQKLPDQADDLHPFAEGLAALRGDDQVDVALAVAGLDVG